MDSDASSETWQLVRPAPDELEDWVSIDHLIPDAPWFWSSLQRFCVPECCGLAAYDFSAASVAWACGWGTTMPDENAWRDESPGDPRQLAADLRSAAQHVRAMGSAAVTAGLFNDILRPSSYADLLDDVARKAVPDPRDLVS